jgi:predicted O-methyltransferase YrrM
MSDYSFLGSWGSGSEHWSKAIQKYNPAARKFLEIGSYEGKSAVFLLDCVFQRHESYNLFCVDTWEGGEEHEQAEMPLAEFNFDLNVRKALGKEGGNGFNVTKLKGASRLVLANLISTGHAGTFDFIYVDGSHQCPDVLTDLTLSFILADVGGLIVCDDYTWFPNVRWGSLLHSPKMAIDSFANCFWDKIALTEMGSSGQPIFVKVAH